MDQKKAFWKMDWFWAVFAIFLCSLFAFGGTFRFLEERVYGWEMSATSRNPSDRIAVIAVDENSINNIGRWPFSRSIHAQLIHKLSGANAKVIACTFFFSEPQKEAGLEFIHQIKIALGNKLASGENDKIVKVIEEAEQTLNPDHQLAEAIARSNGVVLPVVMAFGAGNPEGEAPTYIRNSALNPQNILPAENGEGVPRADRIQVPVQSAFADKVKAVGMLNPVSSGDGLYYSTTFASYGGSGVFVPSFPLSVVSLSLNVEPKDMVLRLGDSLAIGNLHVKVNKGSLLQPFFYKQGFSVDSYFDVLSGKINMNKYSGKIVLLGATALGVQTAFVTPIARDMPSVLVMANEISSLLNGDVISTPAWAVVLKFTFFLLIAVYLLVLLPRLNARMGAVLTASLFVLLLVAQYIPMVTGLVWMPLITPIVLLLLGHLLLTTKRYLLTEKVKIHSEAASAESNRMLGLAYQGQGQLDMAWDKFSKIPMHDGLMDNLYNLSLDFERKRQFNKAEAVLQHMHSYNPKFKDIDQRIKRMHEISETVVLGSSRAGGGLSGTTVLARGGTEKPMLGRYFVEKELGKGAMGIVYLGRDPRINRVVAIKTMPLPTDLDETELQEAKERFFREAETAGRLNHPNIVTIYDAGEEHDLCYIAMELLKGQDLNVYTRAGNLLPITEVLTIGEKVAEALAYAHSQGVVHRDIKPGNIMYEREATLVKTTDFGIARIADASKTKTGMVLGTPSYMSPEQLAGKKIDGRSDIFSLGVSLYQLLCGALPFRGDSLTQLMYQIANEMPEPIRNHNAAVPSCLLPILDKALAKELDKRYVDGTEMAQDLRRCLAAISDGLDVTL